VATVATAIPAAHRTSFDGEELILTLLSGGKRKDPAVGWRVVREIVLRVSAAITRSLFSDQAMGV
jgi:hypothetical protein